MELQQIIAVVVFAIALVLIMTEKVNRTVAALGGACLLLIFRIMPENEAIGFIDFNTIGVLIGMMTIVAIVKTTGLFEYVAIYSAKKVKADPWKIIVMFCIITAVTSALLDNVTTVLLIAPMTIVITQTLDVDPIPFLIPEILASNIGGTSTLIGDPPNIMIGSATGLGFVDFVTNLAPITIVIFVVTMFLLKLIYGRKLVVDEDKKKEIMDFDEKKAIKNKSLLKKCLVVLVLVMVGFFFHEQLEYSSSVVALSGAVLLLMISKEDVEEVFYNVEWPTIFFFTGLFILVGGLEAVGVIEKLATVLLDITQGHIVLTGILIIWLSAFVSAFLDNIPFVATLIPLIKAMGESGHTNIAPLWWAISLGACLGGNGTLIGASANVIVAGIAEKHGYKLTFGRYIKVGFPLMVLSIIISSVYLLIFYLI